MGASALLAPVLYYGPAGASSGARTAQTGPYGDLVVASGETYTIETGSPGGTYYQGGNITVEAGGTLIVRNTTISFAEQATNGNSLAVQFSHIYEFLDAGTVEMIDSGITTNVGVLNFTKLYVGITGTFTASHSTFDFPGWIQVDGAAAVATFNDSQITANPMIASFAGIDPAPIIGDMEYAPTLNVSQGGTLNLLASNYLNTYADNLTRNGNPTPPPVTATGLTLPTTGADFPTSDFSQPYTSGYQLAEATLYPAEATTLSAVSITYAAGTGTADVEVGYGGLLYNIGTASFAAGSGTDTLNFTSQLVDAMMNSGVPLYSTFSLTFAGVTATGPVTLDSVAVQLVPAISYNVTVIGTGSTLNAVDSQIDLNFVPSYLNGTSAPPWASNKFVALAGAVAYLANVSTPNQLFSNYSTSAILVDATSQVILYRWAQFDLEGEESIYVSGAQLTPEYAYPDDQANNATANAANDLATASPAIWGYVNYWDGLHGVPAYGTSTVAGQAWLLLASAQITGVSLPGGNFLGSYNVEITIPGSTLAPAWVSASVLPYPDGFAYLSPDWGLPDIQPTTAISGYYVSVATGVPVILANGTAVANATVREGQQLGVEITLTDEGTARIFNVNATLFWNSSSKSKVLNSTSDNDLNLNAPGQSYTFNLTWVINDTVTGLGGTFDHDFFVAISWNYGLPAFGGNTSSAVPAVVIAPSQIHLSGIVPPTSPLDLSNSYLTTGHIAYNGSQPATIFVIATPVGGGQTVTIGGGSSYPGAFEIAWYTLSGKLSPGTTYYLTVSATYNSATTTYQMPGTYSVPSTTTTTGFLYEKFLGLPLWLWLVIAAVIVVAIVAVLLLFRRQAAGKLVECGECGELIPEDATVCPHCGAEFESDLVRCSRCSSTIPANSQFCPECGAQLLGKPGEGESDPERQAYADFTERFRAEAKKELGDNYTESAFWDWWKRQPTYVPFSQWKAQQAQGAPRTGMSQPPAGSEVAPPPPPAVGTPPRGGAGAVAAPPPAPSTTPLPSSGSAPPPAAGAAAAAGGLKPCPSCGKEIPPEYLVCPFCGAVTQ